MSTELIGTYKDKQVILIDEGTEYYALELESSEEYPINKDDKNLKLINPSNLGPGQLRAWFRKTLALVSSLSADLGCASDQLEEYAQSTATSNKPALGMHAVYNREY